MSAPTLLPRLFLSRRSSSWGQPRRRCLPGDAASFLCVGLGEPGFPSHRGPGNATATPSTSSRSGDRLPPLSCLRPRGGNFSLPTCGYAILCVSNPVWKSLFKIIFCLSALQPPPTKERTRTTPSAGLGGGQGHGSGRARLPHTAAAPTSGCFRGGCPHPPGWCRRCRYQEARGLRAPEARGRGPLGAPPSPCALDPEQERRQVSLLAHKLQFGNSDRLWSPAPTPRLSPLKC